MEKAPPLGNSAINFNGTCVAKLRSDQPGERIIADNISASLSIDQKILLEGSIQVNNFQIRKSLKG